MKTKIIVGRGPVFDGVSQIIEDLAAIGMVNQALLVDLSQPVTLQSPIRSCGGTSAADAFVTTTTLQEELRNVDQVEGVECIVLNSFEHPNPVTPGDYNQLVGKLGHVNRMAQVAVARADAQIIEQKPFFQGGPNVFLAPENSSEPTQRGVEYTLTSDFGDYLLHVATGVCSLAGLWTGVTDGKVFEIGAGAKAGMHMVRCFYHRITAAEVQEKIRELTFTTDPLPTPKLETATQRDLWAAQFKSENMTEVNFACADELIGNYRELFEPKHHNPESAGTEISSTGEVIADFLKRWGREIVTHPGTWIADQQEHARERVAFGVQETLGTLQNSSQYVREVVKFAGSQAQTQKPQLPQVDSRQAAEAFTGFWTSYSNTVFTLIDGKKRKIGDTEKYPQIMVVDGEEIKVALRPNDVIPGPSAYFGADLPPLVRKSLGNQRVAPFDFAEIERCKQLLRANGNQKELQALDQLVEKHRGSLAVMVGGAIADRMNKAAALRQREEARLKELMDQCPERLERSPLAKITRFIGWVAFLSCLIFHAAVLIGAQLNPSPPFALGWQACSPTFKWALPAVWMGLWLIMYLIQTGVEARDARRSDKLRNDWHAQVSACCKNIDSCLRTEQTLQWGFTQFVPVSKLVGSIINNPFGRVREQHLELPVPSRLPDSVVMAKAMPSDKNIKQFSEGMRKGFKAGWMDDQICQAMAEAHAQEANEQGIANFGDKKEGSFYQNEFGRLLEKPVSEDSRINTLTRILASDDFRGRDRSMDDWTEFIARRNRAAETSSAVRDELTRIMQPLQNTQGTQRETLPDLGNNTLAGDFRVDMFSSMAQDDLQTVADHRLQDGVRGADTLGSSTILIQMSNFFAMEDLVGGGAGRTASSPAGSPEMSSTGNNLVSGSEGTGVFDGLDDFEL